jgi:hypothetical protein
MSSERLPVLLFKHGNTEFTEKEDEPVFPEDNISVSSVLRICDFLSARFVVVTKEE